MSIFLSVAKECKFAPYQTKELVQPRSQEGASTCPRDPESTEGGKLIDKETDFRINEVM